MYAVERLLEINEVDRELPLVFQRLFDDGAQSNDLLHAWSTALKSALLVT